MQDDISAGVDWLVAQKIVDPRRVCIGGTSYGGYAALWGLVKTPNLCYTCGVSVAGPSDLGRMLADRSDTSDRAIARDMVRHSISDASTMQAELDAVSPVKQASRLTAPLLLVYGKLDQRVPLSHGNDGRRRHHRAVDGRKPLSGRSRRPRGLPHGPQLLSSMSAITPVAIAART